MKLWGTPVNTHTRRAELTALYAGVELTLKDFSITKASDQDKKDFVAKVNPNGRIPGLETPEGPIYESGAIIRHLARLDKSGKLYGATNYQQSQVDQWVDFSGLNLEPAVEAYLLPYYGWVPCVKSLHEKAHNDVKKFIRVLDNHVKTSGKYLVGDSITIADIAVVSALAPCFQWVWDDKYRKSIQNLTKYFQGITSEPNWQKVFGKPILCQQAVSFFLVEPGQEEETKEEKPAKEAKGKKEEAPKAEKPAKKKDDEEAEEKPAEVKEKNPLDSLPPSTFNLFDFKTLFVNAKEKQEAMDFFWKNFDANGYSLWQILYDKAEGEGKVLFLTSNLMNGFLQRLDHFRKYAFAVHGVYGDEPNLEIRGVWVWRGTELPKEITDLDSFEYHKFIKLDPSKEEDRKKVDEFWCKLNEDEDVVDGLTVRACKYFK